MIGFLESPGILESLEGIADQSAGSRGRNPGPGLSRGWGGAD